MSRSSSSALRSLRALFDDRTIAGLPDGVLLRRFADRTERTQSEAEAAFAVLLDRHGPMVWGVCRRTLGITPDAEDAFQATFLVLARRANTVRVDGSLGRWLHGVASKVATRARIDRGSRPAREARAARIDPMTFPPDPERVELLAALDEELNRLPEKYRSPMVLCHLEGLTHAETAEQLGCPPATIKGRLTRGREILKARLTRRGLGLSDSLEGAPLIPTPHPVVPMSIAGATLRGVFPTVAVEGTTALALAQGVLRSMTLIHWSKLLVPMTLIPTSVVGFWMLGVRPPTKASAAPQPTVEAKPIPTAQDPEPRSSAIFVPLPGRDDLHRLLRKAASEAMALANQKPNPASWTLTTIAKVQARAGDLAGSKETFAAAVVQADLETGGSRRAWNLWFVGHDQISAGLRNEAKTTLLQALKRIPALSGDLSQDHWTIHTMTILVANLADVGARDEARLAVDRLQALATELLAKSKIGNTDVSIAPKLAEALAAVGDFDGAFRWANGEQHSGTVAANASLSAVKHLDHDQARRFVTEAVARMAKITSVEEKYSGLIPFAEAQARMGDIENAKKSARSIGEGPNQPSYDMSDGQPYAMRQIAMAQLRAGQIEPARETLREAYRIIVEHPRMRGPEGRLYQIAGCQVIVGDIEGALQSAGAMPQGGQAPTLGQIARVQAMAGQTEVARQTIERALADSKLNIKSPPQPITGLLMLSGSKPTPALTGAATQLAEIAAIAGQSDEALEIIKTIDDETYRRHALQKIVEARASAGDLAGALELSTREGRTSAERSAGLEGLGTGLWQRFFLESPTTPVD